MFGYSMEIYGMVEKVWQIKMIFSLLGGVVFAVSSRGGMCGLYIWTNGLSKRLIGFSNQYMGSMWYGFEFVETILKDCFLFVYINKLYEKLFKIVNIRYIQYSSDLWV